MIIEINQADLLVNKMLRQELDNLLHKKQIAEKATEAYINYIKNIQAKLDVTINKYDDMHFTSDCLALKGFIEFTFNNTKQFITGTKLVNQMKKIGFVKEDMHEKYHILFSHPCIDGIRTDTSIEKTTIHIFYSVKVEDLKVEHKSLYDISKDIIQNLHDYAIDYDRYGNGLPVFYQNCVDDMSNIIQTEFANF